MDLSGSPGAAKTKRPWPGKGVWNQGLTEAAGRRQERAQLPQQRPQKHSSNMGGSSSPSHGRLGWRHGAEGGSSAPGSHPGFCPVTPHALSGLQLTKASSATAQERGQEGRKEHFCRSASEGTCISSARISLADEDLGGGWGTSTRASVREHECESVCERGCVSVCVWGSINRDKKEEMCVEEHSLAVLADGRSERRGRDWRVRQAVSLTRMLMASGGAGDRKRLMRPQSLKLWLIKNNTSSLTLGADLEGDWPRAGTLRERHVEAYK